MTSSDDKDNADRSYAGKINRRIKIICKNAGFNEKSPIRNNVVKRKNNKQRILRVDSHAHSQTYFYYVDV